MKNKYLFSLIASLAMLVMLLPIPVAAQITGPTPQVPLPGKSIAQFVDPLPMLDLAGGTIETIIDNGSQIVLTMEEFQANVMPSTFMPRTYTGTWVWGYRQTAPAAPEGTYIGPVIVATRNQATTIKFVNNLPTGATTNVLAYKYGTDQTLHWANPLNDPMMGNQNHYEGPIPAVPHLHGGEQPAAIDGGPEQWFTSLANSADPTSSIHGPAYYSMDGDNGQNYAIFRYPNVQEAAPLWFHDHTLGATRLNVYAGIAGGYLLTDPSLALPPGLTATGIDRDPTAAGGEVLLIPLVIQDRMFDTNGQLYFPDLGINPEHPYWLPEFLGDTICVNGKVWPFLNVEPQRYRFLLLNGSNARPYEMSLVNQATGLPGPAIWVIGTDGGYLNTPVKIDPALGQKLVMMPGERYEIIIDFAGYAAGTQFVLKNTARAPYPKGTPPDPQTVGKIMQFRVGVGTGIADNSYNPVSGTAIRSGAQVITRLPGTPGGPAISATNVQKTRQLTLNEVMGMGGPLEVLVNNSKWSGVSYDAMGMPIGPIPGSTPDGIGNYLTELPQEGQTEIWQIINLTADAHPIHLHLVQFQIVSRQNFSVNKYNKTYNALFPGGMFIGAYGPPLAYNTPNADGAVGGNPAVTPYLQGKAMPPAAYEQGWKDTFIMYPGQVTTVVVRWGPQGPAATTPPESVFFPFLPSSLIPGTSSAYFDYVWHCHIIDHEDNEMMRPDMVNPNTSAVRTYVMGVNY